MYSPLKVFSSIRICFRVKGRNKIPSLNVRIEQTNPNASKQYQIYIPCGIMWISVSTLSQYEGKNTMSERDIPNIEKHIQEPKSYKVL